jgi:hypothetical protein
LLMQKNYLSPLIVFDSHLYLDTVTALNSTIFFSCVMDLMASLFSQFQFPSKCLFLSPNNACSKGFGNYVNARNRVAKLDRLILKVLFTAIVLKVSKLKRTSSILFFFCAMLEIFQYPPRYLKGTSTQKEGIRA